MHEMNNLSQMNQLNHLNYLSSNQPMSSYQMGPSPTVSMVSSQPMTMAANGGLVYLYDDPMGASGYGSTAMNGQLPVEPIYISRPQSMMFIDESSSFSFDFITVRMDYVRKVLGIIFSQVGVCFLIVNIFNLKTLKEWGQSNPWFLYMCIVIAVSILIVLSCCSDQRQSTCPVNIILLGLFTFTSSLAIGSTSSLYISSTISVIYLFDVALIITFALIFSLILFAFQTKFDFNMVNCIKYIVLIVTVFVVIYLLLIITWSFWLVFFLPTVAYAVAGALAFTSYLVADLTLMMRRSAITGLTPKSVLYGVILLHTDLINPNGNFWGKC
ncbi:Protein lifeguard 2 [Halotydeus destructor]|nr:Protein lifeguard 2 [Halotydeus destructor]